MATVKPAPAPPPPDGIRSIDELALAHQRVLVRVDFDVPLGPDGEVADDRKLRQALPTLQRALSEGARVVVATHQGDAAQPKSLEPVAAKLAELLGQEVYLPDECVGDATRKVVSDLREGQLCLLENLYLMPEELDNDENFARRLASLCDVYVGEAFACAHLAQASLLALPRLVKARGAGYHLKAELAALSRVSSTPSRPCIGILGGGSFSDKLPLLEAMLRRCDAICLTGVPGNTLLAARQVDLKGSSFERDQLALGRALLARARDQKRELILPVDALVAPDAGAAEARPVAISAVPAECGVFDVGPQTLEALQRRVQGAQTVLWSGALGAVENPTFAGGTGALLSTLAESAAFGVVLGGALSQAARRLGPELSSKLGFISTGGMASLVSIEGKKLAGVEALRE